VLRVAPGFDPLKAQIGPDEYFVLSRIDGRQSVRDIVRKLRMGSFDVSRIVFRLGRARLVRRRVAPAVA